MSRTVMKWWGWGLSNSKEFSTDGYPYFWPWIYQCLNITAVQETFAVERSSIKLPPPKIHIEFLKEIKTFLKTDQMTDEEEVRLCHCYGKSYRDLLRMRKGIITKCPDLIIYPENHDEVEAIVFCAAKHQVCVIPYGGGTNIVGGVEPRSNEDLMTITLHMGSMARLLAIDKNSRTACFQVGILGPDLENALRPLGYTLGHIPDSFEFSSLGGWLATRSAGQQSDAYGKIEDMIVSMKFVTPKGTINTKATPACSIGPNINQIIVGSEGTLGIITEATMQIHPLPEKQDYIGILFPSFEQGVEAIQKMVHSGARPSMIRLLDQDDMALALGLRKKQSACQKILHHIKQFYLNKILKMNNPCLMILGFEGNANQVHYRKKTCLNLCKQMQGLNLGSSIGRKWKANRFDIPYIRDYVMNYGIMVDVAETATTWSNLLPLYYKVKMEILSAMDEVGHPGWVGCHISHCYSIGASLYFTFASLQKTGSEIEQYDYVKSKATAAIVKFGGSLSHHHAIGYEHKPWFLEEVGNNGLKLLQGIKTSLDPHSIINPGKLMHTE